MVAMNNKVSMKDVFQILSTDFHNEKVSTADGVLTFHNELGPKIHKLILDDGYEDPLVIEFAPKVRVCIPLDSFGVTSEIVNSVSLPSMLYVYFEDTYCSMNLLKLIVFLLDRRSFVFAKLIQSVNPPPPFGLGNIGSINVKNK